MCHYFVGAPPFYCVVYIVGRLGKLTERGKMAEGKLFGKKITHAKCSFNQQAEAVALEGEEYWPLGQFEPGRATAGASQHEH